jgi:hypothetical protein
MGREKEIQMTPTTETKGSPLWRRVVATVIASMMIVVGLGGPASASPQGHIPAPFEVGFFYGTFNQNPNVVLLAGGTAQEFCPSDPGVADSRIFLRKNGVVDIKVNDKNQPIYLYEIDFPGAPQWLDQVCSGAIDSPEPFASGTADLKVRISVLSESVVDVFNSVNGKAMGTDGTHYKVRASADLIVENGIPLGNPEDFVTFDLKEIRS